MSSHLVGAEIEGLLRLAIQAQRTNEVEFRVSSLEIKRNSRKSFEFRVPGFELKRNSTSGQYGESGRNLFQKQGHSQDKISDFGIRIANFEGQRAKGEGETWVISLKACGLRRGCGQLYPIHFVNGPVPQWLCGARFRVAPDAFLVRSPLRRSAR
jgi:hypothetical protein